MQPHRKLQLIAALAIPSERQNAARQLAKFYQADDLIIFFRDDQVGLFLPAPGFSQNLKDGKAWQHFLENCIHNSRATAHLQFSDSPLPVQVLGISDLNDIIIVFVSEQCVIDNSDELFQLCPLLAHALRAESQSTALIAQTRLAREKEMSANLLAQSLEKARNRLASTLAAARKAEEALRLADKRKDEFLAILAHELRNPLAPIGNCIELLKHTEDNPQILLKVRKMMATQLGQMTRLIDDLMDVSRITRGKVNLQQQAVPLKVLLDSAIESAKPFIDQQRHRLNLDMPHDTLMVNADTTRLPQVFLNLLNNAAKYSESGGRIDIIVKADADEVTISIQDAGLGLDENELTSIFDMFVQADSVATYSRGGLGIGLTLVKKLVELHQGSVFAKSPGRGKGSEFVVTLPRLHQKQSPNLEKQRKAPAAPLKRLKVLVVDDNEPSAHSMCMIAELLGHQTQSAFTGEEALAKAKCFQPNIVVLDIGLPDISGYEVCRTLRANPVFKDTLFVAQTGWGQAKDKQMGMEAGFDHYLVKPLDMSDLEPIFARKEQMS
ncbi:hybrid sensor histidine kinase/response regulator [Alteromonas sp. ASW11-130]|uniref:hybrid sensor histidine kinase/response regulator n=1 Tax=Alteromonas sp. ASW11-130 TaxID=3015775 RepID=UPI002241B4C5|nr:ATP-binding protein [Alteromonas sp. ASW11-130]MCW8091550.1 ATP-binding protein [Alteromonas sp. ASW11-130]